jgi:S1-C subfamily serine protease
MKRFIFLFIFPLLSVNSYSDSQLTEHLHDIDYSHLSDQSVCSWFQVNPVPEDFINEAKKRGLTCGGVNYSSNNESTTNSNKKSKEGFTIPDNAHKSSAFPLGWSCDAGFIQKKYSDSLTGESCIKARIPQNAYAAISYVGWKCNSGYIAKGNGCYKKYVKVPKNAHLSSSTAEGWKCNSGYRMLGSSCIKSIYVPPNATENSYGTGFICNNNYYRLNNLCKKLPANSYALGSSFGCETNYIKIGQKCKFVVPSNGYASGSTFKCNPGFEKYSNSCRKISIPPNSYASGNGWQCNPGYERNGNSCSKIVDSNIYPAGSGSGFATTKEGHILTNFHVIDGCSEVVLVKNGKSYLTTVLTQDPNNDLAILQSNFISTKVYPLSNEVYLSDDIFAAGFPFGTKLRSSITINKGIISALRGLGDDISRFQIDAIINPGNSGGPIVDRRGNAVGVAVSKLNKERAKEDLNLSASPEGFNFAINSMMAIGLFRSLGIDLPPQNNNELSVKDRNDLFNQGTFYLSCGMTIAQYEKMIKTDKVMFTRDVFFSNFEGN